MSPEATVEQAPVPNSPERFQNRLDLLADCADLRGKFPPNVELKFIYWAHGRESEETTDIRLAKARKLAPHCLMADRVGREVAVTVHEDPRHVAQEMRLINDVIRGKRQGTLREIYGDLQPTTSFPQCLAIDQAAKDLGRQKPLTFFAFDAFRASSTIDDKVDEPVDASVESYGDWLAIKADERRQREGKVLRQLYHHAQQLGHDGKEHQIAVIYGSAHTLVSVAARELGAKVSRVVLDKPDPIPMFQVERALRYQPINELSDLINLAYRADTFASSLGIIIDFLGVEEKLSAPLGENNNVLDVFGALALVALRRHLTASQLETLRVNMSVLRPYYGKETRVPIRKRRSINKALQNLTNLAIEFYR